MQIRLIRSRRKTLSLQVQDGGEVVVRAPYYVPEREIRSFVGSHTGWIEKQLLKQKEALQKRNELQPLTEKELDVLCKKARIDLTRRAEYYAEQIGVSYGRISIRRQKTKWGSCSSAGNLNFNCLLMLAPEFVRDYVVVHELCHRKQMNHSPLFWAEVERILPYYRDSKKWLKQHGQELMLLRTET